MARLRQDDGPQGEDEIGELRQRQQRQQRHDHRRPRPAPTRPVDQQHPRRQQRHLVDGVEVVGDEHHHQRGPQQGQAAPRQAGQRPGDDDRRGQLDQQLPEVALPVEMAVVGLGGEVAERAVGEDVVGPDLGAGAVEWPIACIQEWSRLFPATREGKMRKRSPRQQGEGGQHQPPRRDPTTRGGVGVDGFRHPSLIVPADGPVNTAGKANP